MGQIPHVAVHAAIMPGVFAWLEGFVARVGTYFFEDAPEYVVGESLGLVGAMVCWKREVVACAQLFVLWTFLAAKALHEPHDAVRESPGSRSESAIGEGEGI